MGQDCPGRLAGPLRPAGMTFGPGTFALPAFPAPVVLEEGRVFV